MTFFGILLQQSSGSNPVMGLLLPLALVAIFYVLVFMPMQRQKKQQAQMLKALENGNVVLTSGGIVGTIVSINSDDTLILRVKPDNVKLQVARSSITSLVTEEKKA
ncbi:MAG TPA: preprotein translocase subunit YajC [Bryobacteraceae bacterium]|nr:preprotein translocase subunit YajC [Bryobacteraceae bacterium]